MMCLLQCVQVQAIGMESPQLLQLVESCPVGGETLIMRMLYILTENCKYNFVIAVRVLVTSLSCVNVCVQKLQQSEP